MENTMGDTRHSGRSKTNFGTKQLQSSACMKGRKSLADVIANNAYTKSEVQEYKRFEQLSSN
ncbi:hypothetical protein H5410_064717 [Solanum commersonii]|uniref:Uncharacterized protein n=1 Tax=Solanum commersonii TaxID=4109 RepID=A0A9J5VYQ0_SOLCO|nr:hypothetical protein H5410_064717 [Solanum commersonii]